MVRNQPVAVVHTDLTYEDAETWAGEEEPQPASASASVAAATAKKAVARPLRIAAVMGTASPI